MDFRAQRWVAALVVGTIAVASIAPAAYAGHGRGNAYGHHKWKRGGYYSDNAYGSGYQTRVVYHSHGSNVGPVLAGVVGGFILGAAVTHATSDHGYYGHGSYDHGSYDRGYSDDPARGYCPPPRPRYASARYAYYDPYCDTQYRSLDACSGHFSHARHPQVVQVVETTTHRVVTRYTYEDGGFRPYAYDPNAGYGDEEYGTE